MCRWNKWECVAEHLMFDVMISFALCDALLCGVIFTSRIEDILNIYAHTNLWLFAHSSFEFPNIHVFSFVHAVEFELNLIWFLFRILFADSALSFFYVCMAYVSAREKFAIVWNNDWTNQCNVCLFARTTREQTLKNCVCVYFCHDCFALATTSNLTRTHTPTPLTCFGFCFFKNWNDFFFSLQSPPFNSITRHISYCESVVNK